MKSAARPIIATLLAAPIAATLLATRVLAQDRPLTVDITELYRAGGVNAQLVRIVGRAGEGPGEFQQIQAFAVWRDGRFAVPDTDHTAV